MDTNRMAGTTPYQPKLAPTEWMRKHKEHEATGEVIEE